MFKRQLFSNPRVIPHNKASLISPTFLNHPKNLALKNPLTILIHDKSPLKETPQPPTVIYLIHSHLQKTATIPPTILPITITTERR